MCKASILRGKPDTRPALLPSTFPLQVHVTQGDTKVTATVQFVNLMNPELTELLNKNFTSHNKVCKYKEQDGLYN